MAAILESVHRVISSNLGELPLQKTGSTFRPAGQVREVKEGAVPENTGYTVSQQCAELSLKLNATGKYGIEEFTSQDEDTLTIFTTGGKQYSMPNAWAKEPGTLGAAEMDIVFQSAKSPRIK
ncbi:MAG: phage tail tube protein [Treponema sp.]|nr:phage tail tube protein [Treponema sp.]